VLARHPAKERFDAFWLVEGRVADWGPLPGPSELAQRTEAALQRRKPRGPAPLPAEEVDEVRIISSWLADNEVRRLPLTEAPDAGELAKFAAA
jgi:hypothetical protein